VGGGVVEGGGAESAVESGVAWGAAAVSLPGSAVPGPAEIDAVRVTSISTPDLDTRLSS